MIGKQVADAMSFDADAEPTPVCSTVVRRRHALNAKSVRHTLTIFQSCVPKQLELRITLVG